MHPVAWWAWAAGVMVLAGRTGGAPVLALLAAGCLVVMVVSRRRGGPPVAGYLALAVGVVVLRLAFHVLVGLPGSGDVLVDLPGWRPSWAPGVVILGPVTSGGLVGAAIGGLQLATLLLAVGAAASAAPPTRLLGVLPAALDHVATAVVIAVGVLPSLAASAAAARRARRLRGLPTRGARALAQSAVPVLADALDRSMALAASMDSRGYARVRAARDRRVTPLLLGSLVATGIGGYGLLTAQVPGAVAGLACGAAAAFAAVRLAGRQRLRSSYRRPVWAAPDVALAVLGAAVALGALTGVRPAWLAGLAALGVVGLAREQLGDRIPVLMSAEVAR